MAVIIAFIIEDHINKKNYGTGIIENNRIVLQQGIAL
jgi:hypothetical protein